MDPLSSHSDSSHPQIPQSDDIRRSLHSTRLEIEGVRKRINLTLEMIEKAKAMLGELRATEVVLQESAETMARLLSPFGGVLTDIIGKIAEQVISELTTNSTSRDLDIWPLTYVCSSWRNAILSFPHLWSSFTVTRRLASHPDMLSTVLERSRSHPLSFSLSLDTPAESLKAATRLLVKHSERWKSAHISTLLGPTIYLGLYRRLPILESLKLRVEDPPRFSSEPPEAWSDSEVERRIFEDAPKLTKLEFVPCFAWDSITLRVKFKFPVHQLRELNSPWDLDRRYLGLWEVQDVSCFRRLHSLLINGSFRARGALGHPFAQQIHLPLLKRFRLNFGRNALGIFDLPSLTHLDIFNLPMREDNLSVVQTFLNTVSRGQLKTVKLGMSEWFDDNRVEHLLHHPAFEHVSSLEFTEVYRHKSRMTWFKSFLSGATFRPPHTYVGGEEPPLLFPSLRDLMIDFDSIDIEGLFHALEELLTSRTDLIDTMRKQGGLEGGDPIHSLPPRLRYVCIRCNRHLRPITLENYKWLRDGKVEFKD